MIFKKYYYLDEDFINDAYSEICGYDYEAQEIVTTNEKENNGGIGLESKIKFNAGQNKTSSDTVKFNANKTTSAKLRAILDYIKDDTGEDIPYYEQIDAEIFSSLHKDDIFEGVFNLSFTKIEQYSNLINYTTALTGMFNVDIANDEKTKEGIAAIGELAKKEREKGITCILKFIGNNKFPCYCKLDQSFIKVLQSTLEGEVTVLGKISRIVAKDKVVNLTDLTEISKFKLPNTNTRKGRAQQVQQIKNGNGASVKDWQDEIKGPALELVPIAIYK